MKTSNFLVALTVALTSLVLSRNAMAASVTGTVVTKTADTIVISTPSGQETYHVMGTNVYPAGADVGSRVTINYIPSTTSAPSHADAIVIASVSVPTSPLSTGTTSTSSVTGTVDSRSGSNVVISTPSGQRTFLVAGDSMFPAGTNVGDRVTVAFVPQTGGTGDRADRITLVSAHTRTRASDNGSLPRTAGATPLLAALGLAAIAGGFVLRNAVKRGS
ncbi:MAG: hypothetical protein ACKVU1_01340 [bacterium]